MQKILLTGASGFLGQHIIDNLKDNFEIIGLYHHSKPPHLLNSFSIDITNNKEIENVFVATMPNIVIHCAAISSIAQCENNIEYSKKVNINATVHLAKICKQYDSKFIFCSTDMVFDGTHGNYKETDEPNPINTYGQQKYIAEKELVKENVNALIIRLPLMIGENNNGTSGVIAEMQQKNKTAETMQLFTNEYRSVALVQDIVQGILLLIKKNVSGIYHLAGAQKWNRLQIAELIKNKYNLHQLNLKPTTHQAHNITNRPADASLNIDKMIALGYKPQVLF